MADTDKPLEAMSLAELRDIGRQQGIRYLKERKKAELISIIKQNEINRNFVTPPGKKIIGYFVDGSPILEEEKVKETK